LFAQEIGRQTPRKLTDNRKKVKVSFGKIWAVFFSLHVDALIRRPPLNILSRNQQMLPEKWEDPDSDERVHRFDQMVKGRVAELTHKSRPKKEN
jgi:hypothetical protein